MKQNEMAYESFKHQVVINSFIRYNPESRLYVAPTCQKYMSDRARLTFIELAESPKGWYVRKHITFPYKHIK